MVEEKSVQPEGSIVREPRRVMFKSAAKGNEFTSLDGSQTVMAPYYSKFVKHAEDLSDEELHRILDTYDAQQKIIRDLQQFMKHLQL